MLSAPAAPARPGGLCGTLGVTGCWDVTPAHPSWTQQGWEHPRTVPAGSAQPCPAVSSGSVERSHLSLLCLNTKDGVWP